MKHKFMKNSKEKDAYEISSWHTQLPTGAKKEMAKHLDVSKRKITYDLRTGSMGYNDVHEYAGELIAVSREYDNNIFELRNRIHAEDREKMKKLDLIHDKWAIRYKNGNNSDKK